MARPRFIALSFEKVSFSTLIGERHHCYGLMVHDWTKRLRREGNRQLTLVGCGNLLRLICTIGVGYWPSLFCPFGSKRWTAAVCSWFHSRLSINGQYTCGRVIR